MKVILYETIHSNFQKHQKLRKVKYKTISGTANPTKFQIKNLILRTENCFKIEEANMQ